MIMYVCMFDGHVTVLYSRYCKSLYWYLPSPTADIPVCSCLSAEQLLVVMIQVLLPISYFYYLIFTERSID